jgi:hypothetical protein
MTEHKFKIGQLVYLRPNSRIAVGAPSGSGERPSCRLEQASRFSGTPMRSLPLRDARHFLCEEANLTGAWEDGGKRKDPATLRRQGFSITARSRATDPAKVARG